MPATGAVSTASATLFCERRDLGVDGGDARARGGDLFAARARLGRCASASAAARARSRAAATRARATSRRVTASSRCLREPALAASSASKRCTIGLRRLELGGRGANVRFGRVELRLRLADLLGPRPRLEQTQLRDRLIAVGLRAPDVQLGVGRAQPRNERADFDAGRPRRP